MNRNIAILASGAGTNAENIIRYFQREDSSVRVTLVVSNKNQAGVLERAQKLGVPGAVFPKEAWTDGTEVLKALKKHGTDFVVLAGFLLRVPESLLRAYPGRIVNIHPALLPKFGGKGMYGDRVHQAVVAAGETESGITIHYINERYDEGAVIFQATCPVLPTDTFEDVAQKVHGLEYEHFPRIIEQVVESIPSAIHA
ncbi:MAG: phosphoribosylglycinamide formyltransferase [Mediterranea sp.]|jgi:phosphoribosylglycinamide formyltransferase-1|nr:phosphoribosylglycinamide formyltransferase [Mediterranea sp.]